MHKQLFSANDVDMSRFTCTFTDTWKNEKDVYNTFQWKKQMRKCYIWQLFNNNMLLCSHTEKYLQKYTHKYNSGLLLPIELSMVFVFFCLLIIPKLLTTNIHYLLK